MQLFLRRAKFVQPGLEETKWKELSYQCMTEEMVVRALKKLLDINCHGDQNVSFTEQTFITYAQIYVEYKILFLQMPIIS